MNDFKDLLEYKRIFPPFLSISFALYFIFLKDKFYLEGQFSTTLFLISVILISFTLSFLWRFFELGNKVINWYFIRVYVDFALKHNPQSTHAKKCLNNISKPVIEEFKNHNSEEIGEIAIKLSDVNKYLSFRLIAIIFGMDSSANSKSYSDYKDFLNNTKMLRVGWALSYNRGAKVITEKSKLMADKYNQSYFTEVEVSKMNAGKKYFENVINIQDCLVDENGKIMYQNRLERDLLSLKQNGIIKSYKRPLNEYYTWEFSLATLRWHHLDYLGNKYSKLEERIATKLEQKLALMIVATIGIVIWLTILISFLLTKYFVLISALLTIGTILFLILEDYLKAPQSSPTNNYQKP